MKKVIPWLLCLGALLSTQAFVLWQEKNIGLTVYFQPVFQGEKIVLDQALRNSENDSLALHTLRFYLSHFVFLKNGTVVLEEKNSYHLLDVENENSLILTFEEAQNLDFDHIQFNLGIDSLTQISGAMGGDLDPTKGMFWTWQSGYINVKLEGFSAKSPARNHTFQFHLGGYLTPFQSVQTVKLSVHKGRNLQLQMDLAPFFEQVDLAKKHSIMSPGEEAVALSRILANSFSLYEK